VKTLVFLGLLLSFALPGWAIEHLVFGLKESPAHEVTFPDGTRDTLQIPGELTGLSFQSELRGQFEIVPVGTVPIPPVDCPDLVPVTVAALAPCGTNEEWWVSFGVLNQGTASAGPFSTRVSLTPTGGVRSTKCVFESTGLAVGANDQWACRMANSTPTTPIGDWVVWVQVDFGDRVGESNEGNNDW
jgi:hypothetical protein